MLPLLGVKLLSRPTLLEVATEHLGEPSVDDERPKVEGADLGVMVALKPWRGAR